MKQEYIENTYFVDLGLPSGTKWCKYNLGCDFALLSSNPKSTSPEDWYGKYYAWGEIKDKDEYLLSTYKAPKCETYNQNSLEILSLNNDAAYQYNSNWRIPTKEQCQELINYTNSKWIFGEGNDLYMNVKGLVGSLLTSKINGNQLFIPAAGYIHKNRVGLINNEGNYWTCNKLTNDFESFYFYISISMIRMSSYSRFDGFSIKPILKNN